MPQTSSRWSLEALKEYVDRLIHEADQKCEMRLKFQDDSQHKALESSREATSKAEASHERRIENIASAVESVRQGLGNMVPRPEIDAKMQSISDRLGSQIDTITSSTTVAIE